MRRFASHSAEFAENAELSRPGQLLPIPYAGGPEAVPAVHSGPCDAATWAG